MKRCCDKCHKEVDKLFLDPTDSDREICNTCWLAKDEKKPRLFKFLSWKLETVNK